MDAPAPPTPVPIDGSRGFPQAFPLFFAGRTYQFRLYVNMPLGFPAPPNGFLDLPIGGTREKPTEEAYLVAVVERELPDGTRQPVFARKVISGLAYPVDRMTLVFRRQRIAVKNLNGRGEFGTRVTAEVTPRWA